MKNIFFSLFAITLLVISSQNFAFAQSCPPDDPFWCPWQTYSKTVKLTGYDINGVEFTDKCDFTIEVCYRCCGSTEGDTLQIILKSIVPSDPNCIVGWDMANKAFWEDIREVIGITFVEAGYYDCMNCDKLPNCAFGQAPVYSVVSIAGCHRYVFNQTTGQSQILACGTISCKTRYRICCENGIIKSIYDASFGQAIICPVFTWTDPFQTSPCFATCY